MFKKFLKALLPALVIFSLASVDKAEASNGKINVRVDYLEEGTNKKLADSINISGNEGAFANVAIPQNLVNPYNITRRDFSAEAKQLIANNKLYNNELVYQIYFAKKANYAPAKPTVQLVGAYAHVSTSTTAIAAVVPVTTQVASGHISVSQTQSVTTSSHSTHTTTTIKKDQATTTHQVAKKTSVRKPVGKAAQTAKRYRR